MPRGKQRQAHRFHEAGQAPLGAEEAVAVKPAAAVHTALQHVDSHDTGVHWIWVLPHGSFDDGVPWVAGGKNIITQNKQAVPTFVTCAGAAGGSQRCWGPQSGKKINANALIKRFFFWF